MLQSSVSSAILKVALTQRNWYLYYKNLLIKTTLSGNMDKLQSMPINMVNANRL